MQITFDPHNPDDLATLARLLGTSAAPAQSVTPPQAPAQPETDEGPDEDGTQPDIHGMVWNAEIHSTPPRKNEDGSWRARRGRKDEYEAAIAAHKAVQTADAGAAMTQPDAPASMPASMPAAPAPTTPPEPIAYEAMGARFMARFNANTFPVSYEQIYADLGVVTPDDTTNQTQIAKLWHYLDGLDEGMDHAGAVRHALGSV
jgi:hypothetical protein